MIRPAGMSDEESDSDTEYMVTLVSKVKDKGHGQLAGKSSVAVAGCSQGMSSSEQGKKLNAKERRSQKYWEEKRAIAEEERQLNLSAVEDPKLKPEAEAYFSFAKQANMDLRTDLKEMEGVRNSDHIDAIHNWSLNDVTLVARYPALEELTNLFGEPLSSYRGNPIFYVDANNFDMMMAVIGNSSSNELALDIECNDSHSFLGMTALFQVAIRGAVFLIDPFSCFKKIKEHLQPMIEDPRILKIMFGMGNDCKQFQKDFGMLAIGVIDLQLVYNQFRKDGQENLINLSNLSKLMIENYEDVKSCTLVDWRRRPLRDDMVTYAASDTVVLFEIWDNIRANVSNDLIQAGILESKLLLKKSFSKKTFGDAEEDLRKLKVQPADLLQKQYDLYCLLHQWRERYAAINDEVPTTMVPSHVILRVCRLGLPVAEETLRSCGVPEAVLRHQAPTLLQLLNKDGHDLFQRINSCECHNCLLIGHAAVHCPFPKNKNRVKEFMMRHPEKKAHQNRRRKLNQRKNKLLALERAQE